jgi:hypothetical protein
MRPTEMVDPHDPSDRMEYQPEFPFSEVFASGENLTLDFREAKIQPPSTTRR